MHAKKFQVGFTYTYAIPQKLNEEGSNDINPSSYSVFRQAIVFCQEELFNGKEMLFIENTGSLFKLLAYLDSIFNDLKMKIMKQNKTFRLLTVLASFILLMSSCKKENTGSNVMTEEEAAEVIALSVNGNAEGLATQTAEIAARANTYGNVCSYSKDSIILRINTAGAYTWNYTFKWQWNVLCTGAVPNSMTANYSMKGMYDAPRMSSSDSAIANLTVTNLVTGSQYTYNGTYTRDGSQVSKILNRNSFTSRVILGLTNVKVNKTTGQIDAGTASVSITGVTIGGNSFTYSGTVTLLGNQSATISLNNGAVYTASW